MPDNALSNKRIARNTLFLYLRMFLVLVVSLYTTRVVLRALGVVDYGIQNVVVGFVSMFAFLNTSMSNGIQRFYNYKLGKEGDDSITKVYNTALLIQGLIAIIIVALLETVGLWYLNHRMIIPPERLEAAQWIYQFSVLSTVFVIMQIPYSAAIMAYERMDYYALVSIIDVALKLGFALWLPYAPTDKLIVYGFYLMAISLVDFLLYYLYSKHFFKSLRLRFKHHKDLFKDMLSFSGWNIFGTFAYMLRSQGINVLLNVFFGPVVNAARGVSSMIGNAIQGFSANIVISFRPQTVQSYAEGNFSRVRNLMYSLSKLSYIMLFMFSMPIAIELEYILKLWLGDVVPDYTVSFTVLMLVIMLFSSINTPLSQVVHATGKMKRYQIGTSIVICAILPVAWAVLKLGGDPNTVYFVSIVLTIINQAICMLLLRQIFTYSIREYIKEVIWPCVLITVVSSVLPAILHFLMPVSFIRLTAVVVVGIGGVLLTSYFIALNDYEKGLIRSFIHRN